MKKFKNMPYYYKGVFWIVLKYVSFISLAFILASCCTEKQFQERLDDYVIETQQISIQDTFITPVRNVLVTLTMPEKSYILDIDTTLESTSGNVKLYWLHDTFIAECNTLPDTIIREIPGKKIMVKENMNFYQKNYLWINGILAALLITLILFFLIRK